MAKYQKAENCGPVPYPDQSGKMLVAGVEVEGDEWEPLVALGFVVKSDEGAQAAPAKEAPKAAILMEEPEGVIDVVPTNDGATAEAMDSQETGKSSDEGVSGRAATRRRR